MRVEHLELGRRSVLFEFGFPVLPGQRRERAGDGLPFCYAEAVGGAGGDTESAMFTRIAETDSI